MPILGREKDGTPVIFATMGDAAPYRHDYRKAKALVEKYPTEGLRGFLKGWEDGIRDLNPFLRFLFRLDEWILPDPLFLAYKDTLKQRESDLLKPA